jgi:hypothetical protein
MIFNVAFSTKVGNTADNGVNYDKPVKSGHNKKSWVSFQVIRLFQTLAGIA